MTARPGGECRVRDPSGVRSPGGFAERVYGVVRAVPRGRVVTYGDIARWLGAPRAGRAVGFALHRAPGDVPCQRVVNRFGGLARGYGPAGELGHRLDLEEDGVPVGKDGMVDLARFRWRPPDEPRAARGDG